MPRTQVVIPSVSTTAEMNDHLPAKRRSCNSNSTLDMTLSSVPVTLLKTQRKLPINAQSISAHVQRCTLPQAATPLLAHAKMMVANPRQFPKLTKDAAPDWGMMCGYKMGVVSLKERRPSTHHGIDIGPSRFLLWSDRRTPARCTAPRSQPTRSSSMYAATRNACSCVLSQRFRPFNMVSEDVQMAAEVHR